MFLLPFLYLKDRKAQRPAGTHPAWFEDDPAALAQYFAEQGAKALYVKDLNVPVTGRSEHLAVVEAIQKKSELKIWVDGNFRALPVVENYLEAGADKIVIGAGAYQDPNFFNGAAQRFPQKIVAKIEVRNLHVVIPGMVSPAHKTPFDYLKRFEEAGVAAVAFTDTNAQGGHDEQNFQNIHAFCEHAQVPVLCLNEIAAPDEIEKLFDCESAGLIGAVLAKPLYEGRIDLHGAIALLDDLAVAAAREPTLTEE